MRYVICLLIVSFFFMGCIPQTKVFSNDYKIQELVQRTIYLAPIPVDSIDIENKDDVEDDFGADITRASSVIRDSVYKALSKKLKEILTRSRISIEVAKNSLFDSLQNPADLDKITLSGKTITTWEGKQKRSFVEEYPYLVPKKELLEKHGITPDMIISIQKLTFSREAGTMHFPHQYPGQNIKVPGGTINIPGPGFLQSGVPMIGMSSAPAPPAANGAYLSCTCRFIIYDYKTNKYITHGEVSSAETFTFAMTKETWTNVFEFLAGQIINASPMGTGRTY